MTEERIVCLLDTTRDSSGYENNTAASAALVGVRRRVTLRHIAGDRYQALPLRSRTSLCKRYHRLAVVRYGRC